MSSDIRAWLNGDRSFPAGVDLYKIHGTDPSLLKRLLTGQTDSLRKELFFALKKCISPSPDSNASKGSPATDKAHVAAELPHAACPAAVEAKRTADRLYKLMMNKRAELLSLCSLAESPEDTDPAQRKIRAQLARAIMTLQYEVDGAYSDYRFAAEHGQKRELPAPVPVDVDPIGLHQTISNLRKRISYYRNSRICGHSIIWPR